MEVGVQDAAALAWTADSATGIRCGVLCVSYAPLWVLVLM